ncbi:hypothetical protein QNA08_15565 [Chelatococcus sp. SYSU_G07232]|uniref:Uncharacterized protein n=1 Tax=Chelatococcus albus TaxID=3047466 RepID=A0ABT7AM41_9HYPH|nr:hypothetical protein [Chelatococcus sp. SYSU_G07232]MDJ1159641.1 hypothetical protein [Chelatococcus sp. SYSU_G07232]
MRGNAQQTLISGLPMLAGAGVLFVGGLLLAVLRDIGTLELYLLGALLAISCANLALVMDLRAAARRSPAAPGQRPAGVEGGLAMHDRPRAPSATALASAAANSSPRLILMRRGRR